MLLISTIKARLFIALSAMTLLVVATATVGLFTFAKLETRINMITDEAGPTIEETDDLIATLWESAKVANGILASEDLDEIDVLTEELNTLSQRFVEINSTLNGIVNDPQHVRLIAQAKAEHEEFVTHTANMIHAHQQELMEEEKAKSLLDEFDRQGAILITYLDEFAIENEAEMQTAEEQGDTVIAQNGSARAVNDILGELFEKDYPVVEAALKMQRLVMEMQDTSGEYLAAENPTALLAIKTEFDRLAGQTSQYFKILSDLAESEEDRQDAEYLIKAFEAWTDLANNDEQLFDSYRDQLEMKYKADELTKLLESDVDNADAALEEVAKAADDFMDSTDELVADSVASATAIQTTFIVAALLGGAVMTIIFLRMIVSPIHKLLNEISRGESDLTNRVDQSANNEIGALARIFNIFVEKIQIMVQKIATSSGTLSNAAHKMDELLISVTESVKKQNLETDTTATAITELSSNAAEISRNLNNVSSSTSSANAEGREAKKVVESTVDSIQALATEIQHNSVVVQELNSESNNIGEVLTVIRGIAEQTNLLALNAAIEAARAGEQGRGFAVVADEVRTLAARTQDSTEEIQQMIENLQTGANKAVVSMQSSQKSSENTVTSAREAGEILDKMSSSIADIDEMILQVNDAMQQQSEVTESINVSVSNIAESAQGVVSAAEEAQQQASDVSKQSTGLSALVNQFKV